MALKETWDEPQEWFLQLFSVRPVGVLYLFYMQIPKLDYNIQSSAAITRFLGSKKSIAL